MLPAGWYRVKNALSPLAGCDVKISATGFGQHKPELSERIQFLGKWWYCVDAVRRVDVFVGDRPYQRVSTVPFGLGIMIVEDDLEPAVIQDEVVELGDDRPHGRAVKEGEFFFFELHVGHVTYDDGSVQVAVSSDGKLLATRTFQPTIAGHNDYDFEKFVLSTLRTAEDEDELVALVKRGF